MLPEQTAIDQAANDLFLFPVPSLFHAYCKHSVLSVITPVVSSFSLITSLSTATTGTGVDIIDNKHGACKRGKLA